MRKFIVAIIGAFIACGGIMVLCIELGLPEALSFMVDERITAAGIGLICLVAFIIATINAYHKACCMLCSENKTKNTKKREDKENDSKEE